MPGGTLPALAALICLPVAAVTVARMSGRFRHSPVPQLAAFTPWAAPAWSVVLLGFLLERWWWAAVAVLWVIAVHIRWGLPQPVGRESGVTGSEVGRADDLPLRLMSANVLVGRGDPDRIADAVLADGVDLLAVQEAVPEFTAALNNRIGDALPYLMCSNPDDSSGTWVRSRFPLRALKEPFGAGRQIFQVQLVAPRVGPVAVTVVHTMSPGRGRVWGWARDLDAIAATVAATSGPQVVLGDFNASADHAPFRGILKAGLVDAAAASGLSAWLGGTWPADRWFPPLVRIDHVLFTPKAVSVTQLRTVPIPGSDHRALRADLILSGAST